MGGRTFKGGGVGVGVGAGCGFGVGWGFGGGPTGIAGSGAGGGCGIGLGLGWGYGTAFGAHYIVVKPEFERDHAVKPGWRIALENFARKLPIPVPGMPPAANPN